MFIYISKVVLLIVREKRMKFIFILFDFCLFE